jgi:hypothetical protein
MNTMFLLGKPSARPNHEKVERINFAAKNAESTKIFEVFAFFAANLKTSPPRGGAAKKQRGNLNV